MPELDTVKDRVEHILANHDLARENDLFLIFLYLKKFMGLKMPPLKKDHLNHASVCESVRRVRQKIQNEDNLFLPNDPAVRKRRRIKEEEWREWVLKSKKRYNRGTKK